MTGSLFLSIFFHLFVILIILIGPDIFGLKKKIKINNIPVEVIQIANKTETNEKKIVKKNKPTKQQKIEYSPPKVVKKPQPPEFPEIKKEKKVEKLKKEAIKEVAKKEVKVDRLSSILNTIEKIKKDQEKKEEKKERVDKPQTPDFSGEKLTISEIDIIRRQFIPCWTVPAGIKDISKINISVKLKLDQEGNVLGSKLLRDYGSKGNSYKSVAESVLRAVKHPACKKIQVPKKKFELWKNITLNFDLSEID